MKRFLTIAVVLACVAFPGEVFAEFWSYGFTISASGANPDVNSVPFTPGLLNAFLWLKCCLLPAGIQQGISAAEFGVTSTNPANVILAFTPTGAWLNAGNATNLLLAVGGCPCGPSLAGNWLVLVNAPGSLCLGPSTTGTKDGVDCSPAPALWHIDWIGLNFGGGFCAKGGLGNCYKGIGVEGASWGSVKALYR